MLHLRRGLLALVMASGCRLESTLIEDTETYVGVDEYAGYGMGGGQLELTIPFQSGEYWVLSQGYGSNDDEYAGSHQDWGFTYGNDTYALDFTQSGCEAYGKDVTPMAGGTVLQVGTEDGTGDQGYGNNVLIDHGYGFVSRYGHLSEVYVSVGEELTNTDALGAVGNTGYVYGESCQEHKGTHLHVAFYYEEEAERPEPLSGLYDLTVWCWYNREGDESCSGNPGDYTPVEDEEDNEEENQPEEEEDHDIDDEGELDIAFLDISPPEGTANETRFVWVATVVSPDAVPEATLYVKNPNDGVTYDFEMHTESEESPYVFTYRKTLQDEDSTYTYWVKAENGDGNDTSSSRSIFVDDETGDEPTLDLFSLSPSRGEADETEFEWKVWGESEDSPPVIWLNIVNPSDATIYEFEMGTEWNDGEFYAEYEKTLNDATIYTYWMTAENDETWNSGEVMSVETE